MLFTNTLAVRELFGAAGPAALEDGKEMPELARSLFHICDGLSATAAVRSAKKTRIGFTLTLAGAEIKLNGARQSAALKVTHAGRQRRWDRIDCAQHRARRTSPRSRESQTKREVELPEV